MSALPVFYLLVHPRDALGLFSLHVSVTRDMKPNLDKIVQDWISIVRQQLGGRLKQDYSHKNVICFSFEKKYHFADGCFPPMKILVATLNCAIFWINWWKWVKCVIDAKSYMSHFLLQRQSWSLATSKYLLFLLGLTSKSPSCKNKKKLR